MIISIISGSAYAEKFRVNVNYLVFHIPNDTVSYVEIQFLFLGDGLTYKLNSSQLYQATARVNIQFTNEKTAQVIDKQYNFFSNTYKDTSFTADNSMYNLVRIPLPIGSYRMKITTFDANDSIHAPLIHQNVVKVDFSREKVGISDIQAVSVLNPAEKESNFSKYGYDYMPYFSTFYPENINKLTYFVDIYNLDKEEGKEFYAVSYIAQNGDTMPCSPDFQKEKKLLNIDQYFLIQSFAIDSLPSGNYNLTVDIKDEEGVLYNRATLFFQRSNPLVIWTNTSRIDSLPFDTLKLYLDYIRPIASKEEQYFIDRVSPKDYEAIGDFFLNFWYKRNENNPQQEWYKYYKKVMQVNNNYSTLRFKGYKTDRGHYYLKYGPPNYIDYYPSDVNSFSFEIWTYYFFPATNQTHVYFVFYEKDLVTRDYRLLHSNAIGEIQNSQWKQILQLETDIEMPDDERLKKLDYEFNQREDYAY